MAVGVIVAVGVSVDVEVGVEVLVGVKVNVGVGVSVAKSAPNGLLGPASHATNKATPPKISKPAAINIIFGLPRFLRLRKDAILPDGDDEIGGLLFMVNFPFYKAYMPMRFPIRRNVKIILPEK